MNQLYLAMHGTALREHGTPETIADIVGLEPERTRKLLEQTLKTGRAVKADGDRYLLTPAGRMILENSYSRDYGHLSQAGEFLRAYEQFEKLNVTLKQCITDWQTRVVNGEKVPNDHSDRDYDDAVLERLDQVHDQIERLIDRMAGWVPRMRVYKSKLEAALEKAEGGEPAWVSDVKIDSYHTVWFALHEDLLRMLGRSREE